ncbi:MAG: pantetheine-phosphate adenylyltransferase [Deltaproteobacteria bacterium]|jgi:pantetheine-phosphate adenylyltransferase|nr:pantetheine-phosphate adenylyltransferase [Deltaproteobacteria bacterium]
MDTPQGRFAIYPGTFDPLTNGHIGIMRRGLRVFDSIIMAVAADSTKTPLFNQAERVAMAKAALAADARIMVEPFSGLLMRYAEERGACALLRGLRAISDFDFEFQTALMNRHLNQTLETVFLMTDYRWLYTSSTLVKTVAGLGGNVINLVPPEVFAKLCERFGEPCYGYEDVLRQLPSSCSLPQS